MENLEKLMSALDLKENEKFYINESGLEYRINDNGDLEYLSYMDNENEDWIKSTQHSLFTLLRRGDIIGKVQHFPIDGCVYWYVNVFGGKYWTKFSLLDDTAIMRFKLGNFYRSEEEITNQEIDKWLEFYNSERAIDLKN